MHPIGRQLARPISTFRLTSQISLHQEKNDRNTLIWATLVLAIRITTDRGRLYLIS